MLTHTLRKNFYADWATAWWRRRLLQTPAAVSVDAEGILVLEWDGDTKEDVWRWSPGELFKQLLHSTPDITSVWCCWHLCRQYDDRQETSVALTAAVAQRLGIQIETAVWYWDNLRNVLVSVAPIKGKPKPIAGVKTKALEEGVTQFVVVPNTWLLTTLTTHLEKRAFPRQQEQKNE